MLPADFTGHDTDCACWGFSNQARGEAACTCGVTQIFNPRPPTDSDMLDWVGRNYEYLLYNELALKPWSLAAGSRGLFPTLRQAITAAMQAEKEKP